MCGYSQCEDPQLAGYVWCGVQQRYRESIVLDLGIKGDEYRRVGELWRRVGIGVAAGGGHLGGGVAAETDRVGGANCTGLCEEL